MIRIKKVEKAHIGDELLALRPTLRGDFMHLHNVIVAHIDDTMEKDIYTIVDLETKKVCDINLDYLYKIFE